MGQRLEFLEGRKAALLAILLFGLTFRLGFDGVHPDLIDVLIMARLEISITVPLAFSGWPAVQATPPTTKEDAAKEEEDPGGEGKPDGVSDRGATASAVYPGFCQEKEGKVEDEGDHCHGCGKARNAGAATGHRHFSDMREETEDSRSSGQGECDDVKDETVCYPFDNHIGELDPGAVPE
jgi:hypothetical protein